MRWNPSLGNPPFHLQFGAPKAAASRYGAQKCAWLKRGGHRPKRPAAAMGGTVGSVGWECPSGGGSIFMAPQKHNGN